MGLHIVAISGASGARYGVRLIEALRRSGEDVRLIISREGAINLELECSMTPQDLAQNYGCILELSLIHISEPTRPY